MKNEEKNLAEIAELKAGQDTAESDKVLAELSGKIHRHGEQAYMLSPAFLDVITPPVKNKGVIELAEGEDSRQKYVEMMNSIIDLAAKHAILVPIDTEGPRSFQAPDAEKKEKELVDQATELAAKEDISYGDAWEKVMSNQKEGGN
jgi:hypothetical protein